MEGEARALTISNALAISAGMNWVGGVERSWTSPLFDGGHIPGVGLLATWSPTPPHTSLDPSPQQRRSDDQMSHELSRQGDIPIGMLIFFYLE